jgi:hypothetical protein
LEILSQPLDAHVADVRKIQVPEIVMLGNRLMVIVLCSKSFLLDNECAIIQNAVKNQAPLDNMRILPIIKEFIAEFGFFL